MDHSWRVVRTLFVLGLACGGSAAGGGRYLLMRGQRFPLGETNKRAVVYTYTNDQGEERRGHQTLAPGEQLPPEHRANIVYVGAVYTLNGGEIGMTDEILVRYREGVGEGQIEAIHANKGVELVSVSQWGTYRLRVPAGSNLDPLDVSNALVRNPLTEWAHPNYVTQIVFEPWLMPLPAVLPRYAPIISVNLRVTRNDNNSVNTDETAGVVPVSGWYWNNVTLRATKRDGPVRLQRRSRSAPNATFALEDDQGRDRAATLASSLARRHGAAGISAITPLGKRNAAGDAGLLNSFLGYDEDIDHSGRPNRTPRGLSVSGLGSDFTNTGYDVYVFFEGNVKRKCQLSILPAGGKAQTVFGRDDGDNSDGDDDGVIEWKEATGTSFANANSANYARFTDLTAPRFTLRLNARTGRCRINGFQIVAHDPLPPLTLVVTPHQGATPLEVEASVVDAPAGAACHWDFGDGATTTGETVSHTYSADGTYAITVTAGKRTGKAYVRANAYGGGSITVDGDFFIDNTAPE